MIRCWKDPIVVLLPLVVVVGATISSTAVNGQEHVPIKRSFVNAMDNATIEILKECEDTKSAFTMFDVHSPPGNREPPVHHHTLYQESVQVLDGLVYFEVAGEDRTKIVHNLIPGDAMDIPSDTIHTWWTDDDQGSTFRVTMTPCFDGFHEGLELAANLVTSTGEEQDGHAQPETTTPTFPPFDQWSFIAKTRLHAILWTMMATELDSGYGVGYVLGIVFGKIASLPSNVEMASALRQEFLPHLAQKASGDKQEEVTVDKGDEL